MELGEWISLSIIFERCKMKKRCRVKIFKKGKQFVVTSVVLLNSLGCVSLGCNAGINEENIQEQGYFNNMEKLAGELSREHESI